MREVIHEFGDHRHLNGIASLPDHPSRSEMILLLNAGQIHKVGPFGLNVHLARRLAGAGYRTLRFDFAGLGDSQKMKSAQTHRDRVIVDMRSALDLMAETYGESRVVVIGLCTGAENAFRIAMADDRVVGNIWLDGYGYNNLKSTLLGYQHRLSPLNTLALRLAKKLFRRRSGDTNKSIAPDDQWQWTLPPKAQLETNLTELTERGVKFLSIYTGGVISYNIYRDQFRDTFAGCGFLESMDFEHYPQADHTYIVESDRNAMIARIDTWLSQTF